MKNGVLFGLLLPICLAETRHPIVPEDLFSIRNIVSVSLSPDGATVAFTTREASLKQDNYRSTLWIAPASHASAPRNALEDAESPEWSPDAKKLACISTRSGRPQIVILDAASLSVDLESSVAAGVRSFRWSPQGREIAFLAPEPAEAAPNKSFKQGVVIDKRTFVIYKLLGNELFLNASRPVHLSLLNLETKSTRSLISSIHVDDASWAPDGKSIAITGKESPETGSSGIYLYSMDTGATKRLLEGAEENGIATLEYARPTWSPDSTEFAVISKTNKDRWASSGDIGIYSLKTSKLRTVTAEDRFELYATRIFWLNKFGIALENTVRARTQLLRLSAGGEAEALIKESGQTSNFSFSSSGELAAFVRQDFARPPEVFVASHPFTKSTKVTALNTASETLTVSSTERVHWLGAGGVDVEGLLIRPPGYQRGKHYPLLVMVHGGPGFAVKDTFEPYGFDSQNWVWPYPFRIFAERGYLVLFPNYRGTGSYGKQFRMFRDMAGEPAEDIVSGVRYLIDRGDADRELVGILGHSHGGWLGPYVLTHHKDMFKAASFAEGDLDFISNYGQMPGRLNLFTHEFYNPGTPYDNLQRYIDISPIFSMRGLKTPTLLEFGQRSLAVAGLESVSALWREGVPHEMIVYPREGHNLASPVLQLESIHRNLDWFDYWMLGKKDPASSKSEQYARWAQMAAKK